MGLYQHIRKAWKAPKRDHKELYKERLIQWRKEPVSQRIERPTRLDRARSLGYKAKPGIFMVRQRVNRSRRLRPKFHGGRSPRKMRRKLVLDMNLQRVAEQRAWMKFRVNCEVMNSYWVGEDGKHKWYEVIFVDKSHPVVKKDPVLMSIASQKARVVRGLTSAGRKGRGLLKKGSGTEKNRPSRAGAYRRKIS